MKFRCHRAGPSSLNPAPAQAAAQTTWGWDALIRTSHFLNSRQCKPSLPGACGPRRLQVSGCKTGQGEGIGGPGHP